MLFSLLAEGSTATNTNNWVSYVLIGVLVVILVASMILMNRRSKKREKEAQELIDAVKPGNKVTTIGGVVGIVVAVNPEDNTFVLETGSEEHGKSYIKFIRQAIYESDAVVEKKDAQAQADDAVETTEATAEESVEPTKEIAEASAQEPAVEEVAPVEEATEAKPSKKSKKK
ncbi:MAG: preprotein translocase subunit YajC [Candidatus Coproplasma sp.]